MTQPEGIYRDVKPIAIWKTGALIHDYAVS
jgi:hypothetical protein